MAARGFGDPRKEFEDAIKDMNIKARRKKPIKARVSPVPSDSDISPDDVVSDEDPFADLGKYGWLSARLWWLQCGYHNLALCHRCSTMLMIMRIALQWHHNEHDGVSNHQRLSCLLTRLLKRWWKETSKLRVTGLCEAGGFPSQKARDTENVSIWWRHRGLWFFVA